MKSKIDTLVLSGGGMKGLVYAGVFEKLQELIVADDPSVKIDIRTVCCVSVGALFGLMWVLGYSSAEMQQEILSRDFTGLKSMKGSNILKRFGFDSGDKVVAWIEEVMAKKHVKKDITLAELFIQTGITLRVVATNVNKYKAVVFDHMKTPKLQVTRAIRMSFGIPFVFTAKRFAGDFYVDGAVVANYPITMFDSLDTVLGVKIVTFGELPSHAVNERIDGLDAYIYHVLQCFAVQKERNEAQEPYKDSTIFIHAENFPNTINFELEETDKRYLFRLGYQETCRYFGC